MTAVKIAAALAATAKALARHRIGALIVWDPASEIDGGVVLDAVVSRELLVAIFAPEQANQLRTGVTVIRGPRVERAAVPLAWDDLVERAAELATGTAHRGRGQRRDPVDGSNWPRGDCQRRHARPRAVPARPRHRPARPVARSSEGGSSKEERAKPACVDVFASVLNPPEVFLEEYSSRTPWPSPLEPSRKRDGHFGEDPTTERVPTTMKTKVIGYVRVSSKEQVDEGVSLAAQRAKLQAYAVAMDLELISIEEDAGISAKTVEDRPGLLRALARLDAGEAIGILVVKLDRLTRSVRDLGDLVERYFASKHSLRSVSDSIDTRTAAGRLVLNVLASVAQWEREATAERTRDALAHLQATGVLVGGVPLGSRRTGEIDSDGRRVVVEDAAEMASVRRAAELRAGGSSLRQIARVLRDEGYPTKRGGKWEATTVGRILGRVAAAA